ncbi:peptide ABC transporter substrate-binding protein [Ureibacillus sinduriensis]|uniref:Peptide ABC transporter substrate-binding protein n=1 Tax=Ureibacillus sinduriensis BLB-1 = JCM 15800 TaxID=1384057 RepID=A0A0A3IHR5_9BACL|nr:peptide ABC transporter substrate-binding protein [Ureibacillus sinduriensis]KGR74397.1 peptide ABC transporter substrate-binding protein [Ureibacillus sinduriensis BLB-1 = JCM 15800]
MRKLWLLLLATVTAFVLAACSDKGDGSSKDEVSEYRTVYSGEIKTLNYLKTAEANEFAMSANLIDGLIEYDQYGIVQPSLAEEWSANEDNTVWTFKLREGVKWVTHEGEEYADVVAQDFVEGLNYVLDAKNESSTAWIATVVKNGDAFYNGEITDFAEVGVKALDDYTLEYTMENPTPYFLSMLNYVCFFPVNGEFLAEKGDTFGTTKETTLYNGAFILDKFESQNERVLVKNESYWDKDNVYIDRIRYKYNKEALTVAPELFLRGEIDSAEIPTSVVDEWFNDEEKKSQLRQIRNNFYTYFYALNFNPQFDEEYEPQNWKVAVNNKNFRKSLYHALDRVSAMLTTEPFEPESLLNNTITPKNFVDVDGVDYTQLAPLADISNTDSFNSDLALEFKEKAMAELDGKATFPVKMVIPYNSGSPDWANRTQVVEQQLENLLGADYIDLIVEAGPSTGFLSEIRHPGKYALLEANWGPDYADPASYTDPFTEGGTYNKPELAEGYTDANGKSKYQNLVDAAKAEMDPAKRYELFAQAEAFLIEEAFVIPYAVGGTGYIASKLNPFEAQYSPFGVTLEKFKGQRLLEEPMSNEEFKEALAAWEQERTEALANAGE